MGELCVFVACVLTNVWVRPLCNVENLMNWKSDHCKFNSMEWLNSIIVVIGYWTIWCNCIWRNRGEKCGVPMIWSAMHDTAWMYVCGYGEWRSEHTLDIETYEVCTRATDIHFCHFPFCSFPIEKRFFLFFCTLFPFDFNRIVFYGFTYACCSVHECENATSNTWYIQHTLPGARMAIYTSIEWSVLRRYECCMWPTVWRKWTNADGVNSIQTSTYKYTLTHHITPICVCLCENVALAGDTFAQRSLKAVSICECVWLNRFFSIRSN